MAHSLTQRAAGEMLGTALLLAIVVGSGVMGERLAGGNMAIALLANSLATGAGLIALIFALSPVSGAHLNPVVTLVMRLRGDMNTRTALVYILAQTAGALIGVLIAHAMFALPLLQLSVKTRTGGAQFFSELVATAGLLFVILQVARHRAEVIPYAVGAYITAAYWFTASTSFANPAVTFARAFTDTFSGIRLVDAPWFILAQIAGGLIAWKLAEWFKTT